jgi:uncharacterized protein (TIGR03086 family)
MSIDLTVPTQRLADLVSRVDDGDLGRPTPCPNYEVGDLLDHIHGLAVAFAMIARKETGPETEGAPGDAAHLDPEWRTSIPAALADLAEAWKLPDADEGTTQAGGIDMPGEVARSVATAEVVIHGWDLARAIDRPFTADEEHLAAVTGFYGEFPDEARSTEPDAAFGPVPPIADDASPLDRALALSGRDPGWAGR